LIVLTYRADGAKLPLVRVIDMRLEKSRGGKGSPAILSEQLRISIEKRLTRYEQVILFLNRRGFAGSLQCHSCGHVVQCNHCAVSMTLHKKLERLVCHICGFQRVPPRLCPQCKDPGILLAGFGTERVEETLGKVFPKARIARVDTDSMQKKHQLRETLTAFKAHKLDILIGTQMIAKGLHFPTVTLVGILNADLTLYVPDFRASERTFSLLTQVAGRAGRGELLGEVIIQTYTPHSPAIQFARQHDYEGFSEQELEMRRQCGYPPYGHAVLITCRGEHQRRAEFTLEAFHKRLAANLPEGIFMSSPLPSPLERSHNQFRFQILLRARQTKTMTSHISSVLREMKFPPDVFVVVDVDPVSLA
jgi:primosomal protein N' (replication factor Y)